jgi:H+/gluconate symporter-like permease
MKTPDKSDITLESLTQLLVMSLIFIYVVLPQLGPIYNIFEFLANIISYTVIGIVGALVSLFLVTLIGEMLKKLKRKIKIKLSKFDPRIAKGLDF